MRSETRHTINISERQTAEKHRKTPPEKVNTKATNNYNKLWFKNLVGTRPIFKISADRFSGVQTVWAFSVRRVGGDTNSPVGSVGEEKTCHVVGAWLSSTLTVSALHTSLPEDLKGVQRIYGCGEIPTPELPEEHFPDQDMSPESPSSHRTHWLIGAYDYQVVHGIFMLAGLTHVCCFVCACVCVCGGVCVCATFLHQP
jgi:hypothetical protein